MDKGILASYSGPSVFLQEPHILSVRLVCDLPVCQASEG